MSRIAANDVRARRKFIVTGANGFVGARVVHRLRAVGDVLAVDAFFGHEPAVPEPRVRADLTRPLPDAPELREATVIHTGGLTDADDRQALWDANLAATFNVLDWSLRHAALHVCLLSGGEVYPFRAGHAHTESCRTDPADFAGCSRLLAERLGADMHRLYGLPVTVLRAFFPFQPGHSAGAFGFVRAALEQGRPVRPPASGSCILNPVHVDDLAAAICAAAFRPAGYRTFNVCGEERAPFARIAGTVAAGLGVAPTFGEPRYAQRGDLLGDDTALRRELHWQPRYGLDALATTGT